MSVAGRGAEDRERANKEAKKAVFHFSAQPLFCGSVERADTIAWTRPGFRRLSRRGNAAELNFGANAAPHVCALPHRRRRGPN
jgi:hypothetical protein